MRTIKFRGKRCDNGEWVFGDLEVNRLDERTLIHTYYDDKRYHCQYEVRADTVGQFTSLYDKNGNEIYEGDILLWTRKNVHIEGRPLRDFADRCEIFYDNDDCAFRFKHKLDCGSCSGLLDFSDDRADESYIEVIGNIYDNPELQEGGER